MSPEVTVKKEVKFQLEKQAVRQDGDDHSPLSDTFTLLQSCSAREQGSLGGQLEGASKLLAYPPTPSTPTHTREADSTEGA